MQTTNRTIAAVFLFSLVFSGFACTKPPADQNPAGDDGKQTTDKKTDADGKQENGNNAIAKAKGPCDVVSQDELEGITGVKFPQTTPQGNLKAAAVCEYHSEGVKDTIIVAVVRGSTGAKAKIDTAKQFPNHTDVEAIGDEAVWVPIPGSLDVRQGDLAVSVNISASLGDDATRLKYAKQIAQLLLDGV